MVALDTDNDLLFRLTVAHRNVRDTGLGLLLALWYYFAIIIDSQALSSAMEPNINEGCLEAAKLARGDEEPLLARPEQPIKLRELAKIQAIRIFKVWEAATVIKSSRQLKTQRRVVALWPPPLSCAE